MYDLLFIFHTAYKTQHTAHSKLHTAQCTYNTAHFKLHTGHCALHAAHWTLNTTHCTLLYTNHSKHSIMHKTHCTMHTVHYTLQTENWLLHTTYNTLNPANWTLHNINCTPHTTQTEYHARIPEAPRCEGCWGDSCVMTVTVLRDDVGALQRVDGYQRTWPAARGNLAELSSEKYKVYRGLFTITHECGWSKWLSSQLSWGVT